MKNCQRLIVKGQMFCAKRKRGFSMIELLIVVAIMVIMTGAVFVSRNKGKSAADVESATRQVASQIRALQNEALNGKQVDINSDGIGDVNACGMQFDTDPADATKSYKIGYYDCLGALLGSEQKFLIGKSATNKSVSIASNGYIRFKSPQAAIFTTLPASGTASKITITSKDTTITNLVCIYAGGNIIETKNANCP